MLKTKLIQTGIICLVLVSFCGITNRAHALTLTPVRIELSGDPGATIESEITLINDRDTSQTFYSSFSNFEAQGETGSPNFVDPKDGLGTWMNTDTEAVLPPGTSKIIPVSINIPTNAEPGGYFAAVFWGTTPPQVEAGAVAIGAKTGVLVLLRVNGEVDENGGIVEYGTLDNKNFFTSLPVSFFYRFQNSGGDRVKPEGDIIIKHFLGFTKALVPANKVEGNVLPDQTRKFETTWQSKNGSETEYGKGFFQSVKREWQNFAFGYYKAELALAYGESNTQTTESRIGFWVIPWQLLLTLLVLLFIIRFIWKKIAHHHKMSLMNEMRAEIKKELEEEKKSSVAGNNRPQSM